MSTTWEPSELASCTLASATHILEQSLSQDPIVPFRIFECKISNSKIAILNLRADAMHVCNIRKLSSRS